MKRYFALIAVVLWHPLGRAHEPPPALSQYAPLNVARACTLGENSDELAIGRVLRRLPSFGVFDNLEYSVNGNRVTLTGQVMARELRFNAESVVLAQGMTMSVDNLIRDLTVSPDEIELRKALFIAIYTDHTLRKYAATGMIHIVVERGQVTLQGEVANPSEKQRAMILAKSVKGVSSVVNHLTVCS
jgi:hypothetical protein